MIGRALPKEVSLESNAFVKQRLVAHNVQRTADVSNNRVVGVMAASVSGSSSAEVWLLTDIKPRPSSREEIRSMILCRSMIWMEDMTCHQSS